MAVWVLVWLVVALSQPLPRLMLVPGQSSVSGISSGADLALQFLVAFSSRLAGGGVFAGELYGCALQRFDGETTMTCAQQPQWARGPGCVGGAQQPGRCIGCPAGQTLLYDHCKVRPDIVHLSTLQQRMKLLASEGLIDNLSSLAEQRVYLYKGTLDSVYYGNSVSAIGNLLAPWLANPVQQVVYVGNVSSTHAWPTLAFGSPCGVPNDKEFPPAIQNCNYDGAGEMLQHIYGGTLKQPSTADPQGSQPLTKFDQLLYGTESFNGLASRGFAYIPAACQSNSTACRLHVALHGCTLMALNPKVHLNFTLNLGFNRWADANDLVILYPQSGGYVEFASRYVTNSFQQLTGCFDSYGQTGPLYATREGLQMRSIANMAAALGWR